VEKQPKERLGLVTDGPEGRCSCDHDCEVKGFSTRYNPTANARGDAKYGIGYLSLNLKHSNFARVGQVSGARVVEYLVEVSARE
jgi:hypothetical protein